MIYIYTMAKCVMYSSIGVAIIQQLIIFCDTRYYFCFPIWCGRSL